MNFLQLGLQYDSNLMNKTDIHVHFPKGSISKDGPSAGVTITTALVSLLIDKTIVPGNLFITISKYCKYFQL